MKRISLFLFLLISIFFVQAQHEVESIIEEKVTSFFEKFHPESMMIHLNDETYLTGEIIWYSAYLYNVPYFSTNLSSIAYVELWKDQEILCRQKLKLTEGVAAGDFLLPKNLATGYYQIRGYSTWMKNLSFLGFSERTILIINPESPFSETVKPSGKNEKVSDSTLLLTENGNVIHVSILYRKECLVAILNNGNLVLLKSLPQADSVRQLQILKSQLTSNTIQTAILDKSGALLFEKNLMFKENEAVIVTNKKSYFPRDRMDIAIQDITSEKAATIFSISIRNKNQIHSQDFFYKPTTWDQILKSPEGDLVWSKERIIYPKSRNTLEPIPMKVPPHLLSNEPVLTSAANPGQHVLNILSRNKIINQVSNAYGMSGVHLKGKAHQLNSDIVYYPKDFAPLPTLEDFLHEIVPQVRVKKVKGVMTIRVRNNENSNKLYFYSNNPMIVIDGVKKDDPAEALGLDPQDVISIHITYKLNTLNSSGVAGFADNGIISIFTKRGPENSQEKNTVYEGFYIASTFTTPLHSRNNASKDVVPDLRRHMYWDTNLKGISKTKVSFYLSDDVGEFIIEVKGIRSDGSIVEIKHNFTVTESTEN